MTERGTVADRGTAFSEDARQSLESRAAPLEEEKNPGNNLLLLSRTLLVPSTFRLSMSKSNRSYFTGNMSIKRKL